MRIRYYIILFLFIVPSLPSCQKEISRPLQVDFDYTIINNSYSVPVRIGIIDKSSGATNYLWTFEGGEPATSSKKAPGTIVFSAAGQHKITLEAWNEDQRETKEIILDLDARVDIDFDIQVLVNNFSPADVQIMNKTSGAKTYNWTFQGGTPATATGADPGIIRFTEPGDHNITLQVSNGRESFNLTKKVTIGPSLAPSFDIIPSFEDEDYEAPLKATLHNTTVSGLTYTWATNGGQINNSTAENAEIQISSAGTYTITLEASNGKETKAVSKNITVKPNTNLQTIRDVKLGISSAAESIGALYATRLRKVLRKSEVTAQNGGDIDLVFFGLNSQFNYNKFISPDVATDWTFDAIPSAKHTLYINTQEQCACGVSFSEAEFNGMITDSPLRSLSILPTVDSERQFSNNVLPRIILFKTQDGRKGAIKIKQFVQDGNNSYILIDIKVQKEPV